MRRVAKYEVSCLPERTNWLDNLLGNPLDSLPDAGCTEVQSLEVKIDAHYQEHPTRFTQDNLYGFYRAS